MKAKKIFLSRWVAWLAFVLIAITLAFVFYQTFYLHEEKPSFLFFAIIMLAVLIVIFYTAYRPVPSFLLEEVKK